MIYRLPQRKSFKLLSSLLVYLLLFSLISLISPNILQATGTYQFITKWGSLGSGDGQFGWPWGVAVDSSGNVYVTDSGNNRIQKFALNSGGPTPATGINNNMAVLLALLFISGGSALIIYRRKFAVVGE